MFLMKKKKNGFTLVEMLIVIAIISVLIILFIPNLTGKTKEVNDKGCQALVQVVQTQVHAFYLKNNRYPKDLDELEKHDYINSNQKTCPNEKDLNYNDKTGNVSV